MLGGGRFSSTLRALAATLPGGRRLHTELEHANQQRVRLTARVERMRSRMLALVASRRRLRARRLSKDVLRQVLPLRHAALMASEPTARRASESAFLERSASYRAALATLPESLTTEAWDPGLQTWWIPDTRARGSSAGPAIVRGHAHVSFEEILNGRDLALGGTMIDIGANVGAMSLPRVVLGDFSRVYAIEPDPDNYACLVRNVVQNGLQGLVLPDQLAIGDTMGYLSLRRLSSGTHHLVEHAADQDHVVQVPCSTLDAWVDAMKVDPLQLTFVKSDTQGWDVHVLLGAPGLLRHRHIAWQLEFSPSMLGRAGHTAAQAFEIIRSAFTHVIDLRSARGPRVRRTSELEDVLSDVGHGARQYTNLLLYNAGPMR
ncbi:MAG: FkbM family methyltransferase [Vicinamibacterales bacterium]